MARERGSGRSPARAIQAIRASDGDTSLFAASVARLSGPQFAPPVVVTGSDFRFIVTEQMLGTGVDPGAILIEPDARNTAPAVLAAALFVARSDPDALMLVAPSDHAVSDPAAFRAAVMRGVPAARDGRIVTFGIEPTHAETGYGWLELAAPTGEVAVPLKRFVEKPDASRAAEMLAPGPFSGTPGYSFSRRAPSSMRSSGTPPI